MRPLITILIAVLTATTAFAADAPPPKTSEEIIVTASALPEKLDDTPAAVTVVTRQDFETRAARDIADVLREVPGLTMSRTGSAGRATSLFTRGSNSTHTLVLWNGVPINNPYFAGYDWGRFSTAGVEQVEIVRGPFSALYGSDAVAGVVNVLTAPAHSGVRGDIEAGTHGLRNGELAGSYVGGGHQFTASAERREDAGFARNDDFGQTSANIFWRWTAPSHFAVGVVGRYTSYDLGVPVNLNAAGTAIVPSLKRRQSGNERQLALPFSQTIGTTVTELTLSESRRSDDFSDPEDAYGFVSSSTESTDRRARLSSRFASPIGTIVAGGELARATVNDVSNFGANLENSRRSERALFAEDRISRDLGASRLEVSAGLRYDRFDTFGSQTSPRVAAAWLFGTSKIRAAYGDAFRAPSIGELYFPFSGNRNLRAERTHSYEFGYDFLSVPLEVNVTAFRSRFRDLIVFDNATFAFANIGRASSTGVELSASRNMTDALRVSATYTYLDTNEDSAGQPLLRRPRNSGSLFVGYRSGIVDTNMVISHTGQRLDVLPVFPFARTSDRAYTTVDVNVQAHLDRITPYVKIENAGDAKYEEVRGYPSPRRRAVIGIRFTL